MVKDKIRQIKNLKRDAAFWKTTSNEDKDVISYSD